MVQGELFNEEESHEIIHTNSELTLFDRIQNERIAKHLNHSVSNNYLK